MDFSGLRAAAGRGLLEKDRRKREAGEGHRFGGLRDRNERGAEPATDGLDDQRGGRLRGHPRRLPGEDAPERGGGPHLLPRICQLHASREGARIRGAVSGGYRQVEPLVCPHRFGRDLYGHGGRRPGADPGHRPGQRSARPTADSSTPPTSGATRCATRWAPCAGACARA